LNQLLPYGWIADARAANERRGAGFWSLPVQRYAEEWVARRKLTLRRAKLRCYREALERRIDWRRSENLSLDVLEAGATVLGQTRGVGRIAK
jgi:hypothetical protein